MSDDPVNDEGMGDLARAGADSATSRRGFLKTATVLAASAATAGSVVAGACAPASGTSAASGVAGAPGTRVKGFDRTTLDALGETLLPASIGSEGRRNAITAFVRFVDDYEPVAEEMHGYGYSDVRYLPSDPAPQWRAQLEGLDLLARRTHGTAFAQLDPKARASVVAAALRDVRGDQLPAPLDASHIALALLAHWASSPAAWNLALGVEVTPNSCRVLSDATRAPQPITTPTGAKA